MFALKLVKFVRGSAVLRVLVVFGVLLGLAGSAVAQSDPAEALRTKYASLQGGLQHNAFNQPLVLESSELQNQVKGEVFAEIAYAFSTVSDGLRSPDHWCDILVLHINTKYCHAVTDPAGSVLVVRIGKKTPEELSGVARVDFKFSVTAATQQYQAVTLTAADGPMGTHDYRIVLELLKLGDGRTFMHLTYSYSSGFVGRLAMQAYLATVGHGKLGFTVTGQSADGQPNYIGGLRGVVERNTMRYYLAIDSFLAAASLPVAQQTEGRLHSWFAATERYALQLHEVSQQDYMAMKHDEIARQQVLQ